LIEKDAHHRAVDGLIQIGVRENNIWRFAAQLERNLRKIVRRYFGNYLPDFGRAREGNLIDAFV
jgi:hypothetical protein